MVNIYTLGDFDIKVNGQSILQEKGHSYKTLRLFKYLLTFNGQKILHEKIIQDFMIDQEFNDPMNVLTTQISRVRGLIDFDKILIKPFYRVKSLNGYYIMEFDEGCNIDFMEFENLIKQGEEIIKTDYSKGKPLLREGIDIYKGQYLLELEEEEWTMPIRNRLDRLFLRGILTYLEALNQRGRYEETIELAEKAIQIKPDEETIHIFFIEALMKTEQQEYANKHYQYYTAKLYNNLGLRPSRQMKELYGKLQNYEKIDASSVVNLTMLDETLEEYNTDERALICEKSYFEFLYNLEKRNKDRTKKDIFIGLITIGNKESIPLSQDTLKTAMNILQDIIYKNLKKEDVASQWNDSQLAILAYNVVKEDIYAIEDRLANRFYEATEDPNIKIGIKFKLF